MIAILPNGLGDFNLERAIQRHVQFTLDYTEGNFAWAADELGVNQVTLHRWRRRWARSGFHLIQPTVTAACRNFPREESPCSA